ncbi:MAG: lipid-A-disaccharide synthase, partial [Planctomycetes bacterium]|nr:lipid-A-disaccharide synthase [Planctomycetota bacterium]
MILESKRTIFISAAETSADAHGGRLIRHLREDSADLRFLGLGGRLMENEGCQLMENLVERSAMLAHAFSQVGFYFKLLRRVKKQFHQDRPDLVVLIDSPAWNFNVAKVAHKMGIPVLYYIAPQLWAWGGWRIKKLRRNVDKVACILPFEQQWFTERGVDAVYVGHPLFDDDQQIEAVEAWQKDSEKFPAVALLPGSRNHELNNLWPTMQQIALSIQDKFPKARFLACAADEEKIETLNINTNKKLSIDVKHTSIEATVRYADLALVASGTTTLEVAAQYCPMIIMYHVHPLQWHLVGKWLIKIKYLSLVNILAQKELVPEFMPFYRQEKQVAQTALGLLSDDKQLKKMREDLKELVEPIIKPGAAAKVAEIVKQMLPRF